MRVVDAMQLKEGEALRLKRSMEGIEFDPPGALVHYYGFVPKTRKSPTCILVKLVGEMGHQFMRNQIMKVRARDVELDNALERLARRL